MKTKLTRISKRTLAMVLTVLMMFSMMIVGTISANAYTTLANKTIFFDNSKTKWSEVSVYLGHNSYTHSYPLSKIAHDIWGYTFDSSTAFTDRTALFFAPHNYAPDGNKTSITTVHDTWTFQKGKTNTITANDNDGGSCFIPASSSGSTLSRRYLRVVSGDIASNGWDNTTDLMTYSGGSYTITYSNVAAGSYNFAVVGFNDWNTSYRASAIGTATNCTLTNANDNEKNIKLTLSKKSNVTITLTSANKVNVTATFITHNVSFSQPTNGEIKVNSSTTSPQSVAENTNYTVTVTPDSGYKIKSLTIGSVSEAAAVGKTDEYSVTKTMGTSNVTVVATFEQNQPVCSSVTLTRTPSGTVYKGTEYTFTANAVDAVNGATYHFYLDGSSVQNTSSKTYTHTFTDTRSHNIYVQVEKTGYTSVKSNTLTFTPSDSQASATKNVTYYIDLHDNNPTTNPTIKFDGGTAKPLTKVGNSTVYSATVSTPYKYDAVTGNENTAIADIPATVSCNGCEYPVTIGKKAITTGEAWLESIGELKKDKVPTSTTTSSKKTKNTKIIYLIKPSELDSNAGWYEPYLYYDADGVTWQNSKKMTYIGENKYSQYVYACEVSKDATVGVFKGFEGDYKGSDQKKHRSVNADLSAHNGFYLSSDDNEIDSNDDSDGYGRKLNTYDFEEAFVYSHPSTITISSGSSTNISMTKDDDYTGASITYSVPSAYSGIISVSGSTLTAKPTTTRKTATITGTVHSGYYSSISTWSSKTFDEKTFTISVTVEPEVISGSFKVMSYKSVSSTFSVENGTFNDNAISTVLTGSEATGNKDATLYNCGIITQSGNEYTVKYAENEAETGYNMLRLTVTVSASPNDGYGFDGWYVDGDKSSQYKNENDEITVDGKGYTLKYVEQTKWTVNITYNYDLYDNSKINYYDEANAENDIQKEYKVEGIEFVGSEITDGGYTEILIHNAPNLLNDYYEYHLVSTAKSDAEPDGYVVETNDAQKTCNITAKLKKTVRTYTVYLNGDIRRAGLTYQEPFTIKSGEVSSFNSNQNLIWKDDGKKVATGTSYSFRVTGDMHITAEENKDGVTFNGKSIIAHRSFDVNTAMKQLVHNFYIADFYNDDLGSYVDFVGGGALYFAMDKTTGKPTKATGAVDETGEAIEGKLAEVVERVAGGGKNYYNDQLNVTDNDTNIVCRYLKYNKHKELFKYSDELQAYQYIYSPSFLNDDQYKNYRLRVYSYFIYEDLVEGTYIISVSDDHADAELYEAG